MVYRRFGMRPISLGLIKERKGVSRHCGASRHINSPLCWLCWDIMHIIKEDFFSLFNGICGISMGREIRNL